MKSAETTTQWDKLKRDLIKQCCSLRTGCPPGFSKDDSPVSDVPVAKISITSSPYPHLSKTGYAGHVRDRAVVTLHPCEGVVNIFRVVLHQRFV